MIRNMFIPLLFLLSFLIGSPAFNPTPASAADYTVKATWLANTEEDLASYRLYQGDTLVATIPAGTVEWTGSESVTEGTQCFTLTAVDAAGNESGRSLPACLDIPPGTPTGFVISIIITIITK